MFLIKANTFRRSLQAAMAAAALTLAGIAVPASALAASASSAAGPGAAAQHAKTAAKPDTTGAVPVRKVCPAPKPGYASCLSLARTGIRGHLGIFAAGTSPDGYGPSDLQSAYRLPSATKGAGQTVAVVDADDDPHAAADLAIYRKQYGLPPCTAASGCFRKVNEKGQQGAYPAADPSWAEEESLDIDMVSAICPNCHILLVEATSASVADLGEAVNTAVSLGAKYVSNSYGAPEYSGETASDTYYDHPGVAITAGAGDSGYGPSYPATSEYVTAVGGTSLTPDSGSPRGWAEAAWANGGSGCSLFEPKPAWQTDSGCGANHMTADVSADADPATGVAVYDSYNLSGWEELGGTSVASPIVASVYALAGPPAPGSYPASYPYADPSALNDITDGANAPTCTPAYWCTAGPGYDGPTGLGTPDGIAAFFPGQRATITGTVTSAATGKPITGARVQADGLSVTTISTGQYTLSLPAGTYQVTASDLGYATEAVTHVKAAANHAVTKDFRLRPVPTATVTGTVTDGSGHHWPLLARISVAGTTAATYTDPATGKYLLALPANSTQTLDIDPVYPGYRQVVQKVTTTTTGLTRNISVPVDPATCTAPGYKYAYRGATQTFNASTSLPPGWTTTANPATATWEVVAPTSQPNQTGGTGNFALSGDAHQTTSSLFTPVTNLSSDRSPVLRFRWDSPGVYVGSAGAGGLYVDLSTNGGSTWRTVWQDTQATTQYGTNKIVLPLPQAAGKPQVQIRFRWVNRIVAGFPGGWQLDNVFLGNRSCEASTSGGLVTGTVTDGNTGQGITGADVTNADSPQEGTATAPIPGDPVAGAGFYWMFSPLTGSQQFQAAAWNYGTRTATTEVTANAVTQQNFALTAGRVRVTPRTLAATEQLGGTTSQDLTLKNTGAAPVTLTLGGQPSTSPPSGSARDGAPTDSGPAWVSLPHYPLRILASAVVTDPTTGDVYSFGGMNNNGYPVKKAYMYQPGAASWTPLPNMPITGNARGIEQLNGAYVNGKIYLIDGVNFPITSAPTYIYNIATGAWSQGSAIPNGPIWSAGAAVVNGKIYVVGGNHDTGAIENTVEVYNPATGTWSFAHNYPFSVYGLSCAGLNRELYCAGGITGNGPTTDTFAYNPGTDTWSSLPSMPKALFNSASTAANGQFLISGGYAANKAKRNPATKLGYAYTPGQGWTELPQAPVALPYSGGSCGFYRIGGGGPFAASNKVWQLTGYDDCGSGTPVPWLSVSPATATLQPGQSITATVTMNAGDPSVTQPGTYTAQVNVESNTPYQLSIPVTMTVTPPPSWGEVTGTVTDASTGTPVSGATVQICTRYDTTTGNCGAGSQTHTLTTAADGSYGLWLDDSGSPVQVLVTANGYAPQAKTARFTAGKVTNVNITLTRT
jgi:hypothetical protein